MMVKKISELMKDVNFVGERNAPTRPEGMTDIDFFEKCIYWYVNPSSVMTKEQLENAQRQNDSRERRRLEMEQRRFYEKLEQSGVDERFFSADIDTMKGWNASHSAKIASILHEYRLKKWLTFTGVTGKGKTFIACAMVIDKIKHGQSAEILTSKDLIDKINGTNFEKKEAVKERYAKLDLLVIDEMGRHSDTENARNIIFDIIKKRHAKFKQTIIASNMSNEELFGAGGFFDDVVSRRVSEEGKTFVFNWDYKKSEEADNGNEAF